MSDGESPPSQLRAIVWNAAYRRLYRYINIMAHLTQCILICNPARLAQYVTFRLVTISFTIFAFVQDFGR